jgi:hypothetical protein
MSAEVVSYQDVAERFERDRKAFRLRLNGVPERQIAETLGYHDAGEVASAVARMSGGVNPSMRQRALAIDLDRLDDLMQIYYQKARQGDHESGALCVRFMDRRAKYLGLDIQPRGETALNDAMPAQASSTDRIMAALDRLADGPIIEGEAIKDA